MPRGRKPIPVLTRLAGRVSPEPCEANRALHWFYTGPVWTYPCAGVGPKGRPYHTVQDHGTGYLTVSYITHRGEIVPHPVPLSGRSLTPQRALWHALVHPDLTTPVRLTYCPQRAAVRALGYPDAPPGQTFGCINPWHVRADFSMATTDRLTELTDLIAEWTSAHPLAPVSLFITLYVTPEDWTPTELRSAVATLTAADRLTPRWAEILNTLPL